MKSTTAFRIGGVLAILSVMLTGAALADTQKFVVIANGETVGHLTAEVSGERAAIDYAVLNNGRGSKARERIDFDAAGYPVRWTIDGQSTFGNPVSERFTWTRGTAKWSSQADSGSVAAPRPLLYIGNDASPWIQGIYVRQLLKAPGRTLPVLPSGQLRLTEVRKVTLGEGAAAVSLTLHELAGATLEPSHILVDEGDELFGFADGSVLRAGYERFYQQLQLLSRDVQSTAAERAQSKLAHRFTGPVRIRNVRLFDPVTGTVGPLSQVVVYANRIAGVSTEGHDTIANDETVIDGEGGTLVPGLHDLHSHTSMSSNLFNLAAGVTATRDQGNDNEELLEIVRAIESGRFAGPRIVRNGLLEGRSPHSARIGLIADTLEQALQHVRWYAEHGYWQIKIYNSLPPEWVAPVAAEAHKLGLGVTGHVPAFSSPDRVIREGYDDIAHVNQLMLGWILDPTEDTRTPLRLTGMIRAKDLDLRSERVLNTVAAMKSNHVSLDTTACALEQLMLSRAGEIQPGDVAYLSHMPIAYQRYRKRSFVSNSSEAEVRAWRAAYQRLLDVLELLDTEGIQLLPGTDDDNGFAQLRELELYVMAGMSPSRALYLGTLGAARYLGRADQLGTIERGKLADFLLVEGEPTQDIGALRKNRMTMKDGIAYFPAQIYEHLSVKPFALPPPRIVANTVSNVGGRQ